MGLFSHSHLFLSVLLLCLVHSPTFALKKPYIVYLGSHAHGPEPTAADFESVTDSHYDLLGSYLGSNEKAQEAIFYSYTHHINGFAAILEEDEAAEIAKHANVLSVFLSKRRELHTTRSWHFLGLERNGVIHKSSILRKARFGEDTIIGSLDTGVWPESKSFSDEGMGPIPRKWRGICQRGIKDGFSCNRKLIGARYFNKGYAARGGHLDYTFYTARDHEGHGSHTLSTAGGSFVPGASFFGYGNGTAKGGSPRARVAAYKVCWPENECFDADILAGFDAAISDGVDVLSVSLGGNPEEYFMDSIAVGSFHAARNGIVVVSSAGNRGPPLGTVGNVAPWMITVAASTIDREFTTYVALGDKQRLKGSSLSANRLPSNKFYPLISGADAKITNVSAAEALRCLAGTLDHKKVKGKILTCLSGAYEAVNKGHQAALAGAVGMVLANDEANGKDIFVAEAHVLPTAHISFLDGKVLFTYINSTKFPVAHITRAKTMLNTTPAPIMTSFSSRGPNTVEPAILKPDIAAPGVNIIAAYSLVVGPTGQEFDKRRTPFKADTGTSMACPHVSGIAGLLKTLYPSWSPAAIQSAIMTTASTRDNKVEPVLNSSFVKATPFSYGAGHIRPNRAMDPGLVYDLTVHDYLDFICARGYDESQLRLFTNEIHTCPKHFNVADMNYPSITVPNLNGTVVVTRRVRNVGTPGTYYVRIKAPAGVLVSVQPQSLVFERFDEEKEFKVVLKPKVAGKPVDYVFGRLIWSDGVHYVRSPLVVKHR
ncbi:hypothetical protein EUGRSUZ_F03664 [Eucalyptus grandis]|uniref:Uncharacterized protein n=2 Tax=Eucalyptus grandis TaxID=71139 RepID=A0ACC3KMD5_EUCGR|nr:hypothetical protein EUGRSUZ_F03664 [Eucalyptus grandis]